ncbi:MAG: M48 family metalloprotease [Salibacteraceae bacterium]
MDAKQLLRLPASYKWRVFFVLLGVILFWLFYFALVAGTAYLTYLAAIYEITHVNKWTIFLKLVAIAGAAMLFVFSLKFLFSKKAEEDDDRVELKEQDYPELFAFVRQLTRDTGAPFPKKIVATSEINAAVYYEHPMRSLFLPERKNLLIGLGLVNSLNLTEFKAVLAHEFGHFAQRSMKLGSYVYVSFRVIDSMVNGRDYWDNLLDGATQSDIRIAAPALALKAVVFLLRQTLWLCYKGLYLLHMSLSRQMEFNADLVAVSVTGSNAIVNGLAKLDGAGEAMGLTFQNLGSAADHQLYSSDFFFHHQKAIAYLEKKKVATASTSDSEKEGMVFSKDELEVPVMYASHPPNYQREQNAKQTFVKGVEDQRSPWELFKAAGELKMQLTRKLYRHFVEGKGAGKPVQLKFSAPEQVQQFIESELQDTEFHPRYHNTYENRFLIDLKLPEEGATLEKLQQPAEQLKELYEVSLAKAMTQRQKLEEELNQVASVVHGVVKNKHFQFRGEEKSKKEARTILKSVEKEWETNTKELTRIDQQVVDWHFALASTVQRKELHHRYEAHLTLQNMLATTQQAMENAQKGVQEIISNGQLDENQVVVYQNLFTEQAQRMDLVFEEAKALQLPTLPNLQAIEDLKKFLCPKNQAPSATRNKIVDTWINPFLSQCDEMSGRLRRLHFKSLSALLELQEHIAAPYIPAEQ